MGWFKRGVSALLSPLSGWLGAYNSTDPRRKILELFKVQKSTADQALAYNLPTLVNQCRHLTRNCPSARAVQEGLVADIVGTGIDVAPDTGSDSRDEKIRERWLDWAECAGVDGTSLWELQGQAVREIVEAGAFLWRYVTLPERAAQGLIPRAILPLEVEWLSNLQVGPLAAGTRFVNGIEIDKLGRPVAYHLLDPNFNGDVKRGERVEAKDICHGFEKRRPYQAHGEPVLAPIVERLQQEEDLVKIELQSAKIASNFAVFIGSEYHPDLVSDDDDTDPVTDLSPGTVVRGYPGEQANILQSSRPNQQISPFREMLRGDIAAASRVSRKWLDRNYSSATFMNTRMEQADAKRQHKPTQNWLARHIASRPYLEVLPWLMLASGQVMPAEKAPLRKMQAHKVLPDLPEYVDPLKDGEAAIQNVNGNLSTLEDECSSRGKDWMKIAEQRAKEKKALDALGLTPPDVMGPDAQPADGNPPPTDPPKKPSSPKKKKPE
jgi:lambda family phage portal protein